MWLNCNNFEWNWTNWVNCWEIFDRFFLRLALSLIAFKLFFISLVNGNSIQHVPNAKIATHLTVTNTLFRSTYCIKIATKNPMGFFVSNGSLQWNLEKKNHIHTEINRDFFTFNWWTDKLSTFVGFVWECDSNSDNHNVGKFNSFTTNDHNKIAIHFGGCLHWSVRYENDTESILPKTAWYFKCQISQIGRKIYEKVDNYYRPCTQ